MQEPWYEERRHREMRSQQTVAWLLPHPLVTLGALEIRRMPEPPPAPLPHPNPAPSTSSITARQQGRGCGGMLTPHKLFAPGSGALCCRKVVPGTMG